MLIHRLEYFQTVSPCPENQEALDGLNIAIKAMYAREARMHREREAAAVAA